MNNLANTTVLSNFAATAHLSLLRRLVTTLYIPHEVLDEVVDGREAGYSFYEAVEAQTYPFAPDGWLRLVTMTEDELLLLPELPRSLHRGEAACIVIAKNRGWGFFTDDRAARRQATSWEIPYAGTLGLLLTAVKTKLISIDEGNQALQQMIKQAHYYAPYDDLRLLLPPD